MFRSVRPWACALFALALVPSTALAWTDATVRTARARVALSEDASTIHVVLTAELRVDRGWLEGFELDGLDEGLVLDELHPVRFERWAAPELPAAVDDAPEPEVLRPAPVFVDLLSPRVSVHDGRIALGFTRRHAPRAGLYRVIATYDAPAEGHVLASPEHAELVWTLPAWRYGLDNVEVVLVLPEGSTPSALAEEDEVAITVTPVELEEGERGVAFRFDRVHLPRTQSWMIRAELPPSFRAAAEPDAPASAPTEVVDEAASHPAALVLVALALALLVVAKVRSREQDAEAADASTGALVPLRARAVLVLAVVLFWVAVAVVFAQPALLPIALVALALLGAHRASRPGALRLGSFRSAWGGHVRAARAALRRRRFADPFDLGTGPGGLLGVGLAVAIGLAAAEGALLAADAALAAAAFVLVLASGGGAGRARPARLVLGELLRWSERRRVWPDGVALAPLVHVDIQGRVQAARLRLVIDGAPEGLVRSDVVLTAAGPRLILAARGGTPAERLLLDLAAAERWPLATVAEERVTVALELARLSALLVALRRPVEPPALARAS